MTQPSVSPRADAPLKKRRRRWPRVLGVIGACLLAFLVWNYWPVESTFTIGPDTTVISGPINPDGTINYTQYLIDRFSEGVTPDNNGARQLALAIGPEMFKDSDRAESLRQLGLSEADLTGPFFEDLRNFCGSSGHEGEDIDDLPEKIQSTPWTADEYPIAAEWLAENERALTLVSEACAQPHVYLPIIPADTPPHRCWRATYRTSIQFEVSPRP